MALLALGETLGLDFSAWVSRGVDWIEGRMNWVGIYPIFPRTWFGEVFIGNKRACSSRKPGALRIIGRQRSEQIRLQSGSNVILTISGGSCMPSRGGLK